MNFFPPLLELNFYSLTKEQFSRRLLNNSDKKISNYRCRALVSCVPHLLLLLQLDIVFHVSGFLLNHGCGPCCDAPNGFNSDSHPIVIRNTLQLHWVKSFVDGSQYRKLHLTPSSPPPSPTLLFRRHYFCCFLWLFASKPLAGELVVFINPASSFNPPSFLCSLIFFIWLMISPRRFLILVKMITYQHVIRRT